MRVRVYYNIRKHCLSVMDKATRRVIRHANAVCLTDVKFIVSQKGVERIRRNQRKAVVAFVEGELEVTPFIIPTDGQYIKFNPYKWNTFVLHSTEQEVKTADVVHIDGKTVMAYGVNVASVDNICQEDSEGGPCGHLACQ